MRVSRLLTANKQTGAYHPRWISNPNRIYKWWLCSIQHPKKLHCTQI